MEYAVSLPLARGSSLPAMGDPLWILNAGEKPGGGGRLPEPEAEREAVISSPTGQTKRTISMSSANVPEEAAVSVLLKSILERLDDIAAKLDASPGQCDERQFFSTSEVAVLLGKAEFTVREWCRLGRIEAKRRECGRGKRGEWMIAREEVERVRNQGLLPHSVDRNQ
jgi:Helix-turn-helix domain